MPLFETYSHKNQHDSLLECSKRVYQIEEYYSIFVLLDS